MLDFSRLRAPDRHGDVLVEPTPSQWLKAARDNHDSLSNADSLILGRPISHWRRRTRQAVVGRDDTMVIVMGHQPELFHPGVWAKRVVADRMAAAIRGVAVSLVVDNDAPHRTGLAIPTPKAGHIALTNVAIPQLQTGQPFEYAARMSNAMVSDLEEAFGRALGKRFATSQIPAFIEGMKRVAEGGDWVDQILGGTEAVDSKFGVSVLERRVSRLDMGPLLADMMLRAGQFAKSYNAALATYRRANRVRGQQRPIPDLQVSPDWCEVPVWATRIDEQRRRLSVRQSGTSVVLRAGETEVAELSVSALADPDACMRMLDELDGWHLRPRALALTIWARLLLSDLFVHGIGGAKYDRISDTIMADYYGVTPPRMVCVSATLHLDLPHREVAASTVRARKRALRDTIFNPQRNLTLGPAATPLLDQRVEAIRTTELLRRIVPPDRPARRVAYDKIRRINQALLDAHIGEVDRKRSEISQAMQDFRQSRIACDREYFFGLHDDAALHSLLNALPSKQDFRV